MVDEHQEAVAIARMGRIRKSAIKIQFLDASDMAGSIGDCGVVDWKKKNEKSRRTQFIRELDQIKLQRHGAERERLAFVFERRDQQFASLQDTEKSLNADLKSERTKLEQQLRKIKGKVSGFQQELKHVKATPEFVNKLKETMEDIESAIREFKEKQTETLETLTISEKETEQEIKILESKIQALSDAPIKVTSQRVKGKVRSFQADFPKEIQDFEAFVSQNGGLQGGWDDYDHGAFLRIRHRHKGNRSFISAAARQIPGRTQEDIEKHENWYSHFMELKQRKMDVIAAWRQKRAEKENLIDDDSMNSDDHKREDDPAEKKKLEEERRMKKEQIMAWKNRKREEKEEAERRKREEEMMKVEAEERMKMEKRAEMEEIRARLKAKREDDERLQWMRELEEEQAKKEQQQEIRENLSRFQERDRVALSIRMREQRRKEEQEIVRKERLERTKEKGRADMAAKSLKRRQAAMKTLHNLLSRRFKYKDM